MSRVGKRSRSSQPATGYVVGGTSPLGQRQRLTTVVDSSARDADMVSVSGGRRGLDIGLSPEDLITLTSATNAPIARTRG
jgi:Cys-tRNA(Pro)/Cys-tRNA(Cys) deacylase